MIIGCSAINSYFDNRQLSSLVDATNLEDVIDGLEWANERLNINEENNPSLIASIIPVLVNKCNSFDIKHKNSDLYEKITDKLILVTRKGITSSDDEEWIEQGFKPKLGSEYFRVISAQSLDLLNDEDLLAINLNLIKEIHSPAVQKMLLQNINKNIDFFKSTENLKIQTILSLAKVNTGNDINLINEKNQVENSIVDLSLITSLFKNKDSYEISTSDYEYIFDLNERILNQMFLNKKEDSALEIQSNLAELMDLSLPEKLNKTGYKLTYKIYERKAQSILLKYAPGLFYYQMHNNIIQDDYALAQTISHLKEIKVLDRKLNGKSLFFIDDKNNIIIDHKAVFGNNTISKAIASDKKYLFSNLRIRVEKRNEKYIDFIYENISMNYPSEFARYLTHREKKEPQKIIKLKDYYSIFLSKNHKVNSIVQKKLKRIPIGHQFVNTLLLNKSEYSDYVERNYPIIVDYYPKEFASWLNKKANNIPKQKGYEFSVDYYLLSISNTPKSKLFKYVNYINYGISMHDSKEVKKLFGVLNMIKPKYVIGTINKVAFRNTLEVTYLEPLYISNYIDRYNKRISKKDRVILKKILKRIIKKSNSEDTRLVALQQLYLKFPSERKGAQL